MREQTKKRSNKISYKCVFSGFQYIYNIYHFIMFAFNELNRNKTTALYLNLCSHSVHTFQRTLYRTFRWYLCSNSPRRSIMWITVVMDFSLNFYEKNI